MMPNVQVPNSLPHRLHCRGTDCWIKSAEQRVIPETSDPAGSKAVAKEVKFDIGVLACSMPIAAVNKLGFRRMHFQVAFRQPRLKLDPKGFSFVLGPAVY